MMRLVNVDCEKCKFAYKCSKGKHGDILFHFKYHSWTAHIIWIIPFWYEVFHDFFKYWALAEYAGPRTIRNISHLPSDFKLAYDLVSMRY